MLFFPLSDMALEPSAQPWQDARLMKRHGQMAKKSLVRSKAVWGSRATTVDGNPKRMKRGGGALARRLH